MVRRPVPPRNAVKTAAGDQEPWEKTLPWQDNAVEAGALVLREHSDDLRTTAERVTRAAGAGTVAPTFVFRAAEQLGLEQRSSPLADSLFGLGTLFFGAVPGVGGNLLLTPTTLPLWVVITLLAVGVLSAGACASGLTLKLMRR